MDLNLEKIDGDLKDGKNPARRLSGTGGGPVPITTIDEQLDDMAIAEAVAEIEAEIKKEEPAAQLPDYFLFNLAFAGLVIAFWLKYFKII